MQERRFKVAQRRLPHWELDGAVYFITFNTWERLELSPAARRVVLETCLFFNNQRYVVFVLVVMPDHVHLLIQPLQKSEHEFWELSGIMKSIKGFSAKKIPQVMKHVGIVWQDERFDRIIRTSAEFQNTWHYIQQNPVKAGLAPTPEAYPFFWKNSNSLHS
ncbi:MAG: transposase [Leptolyngbyaceae cyanobacterium SL_7_1]|nr:transposase [Leptolyngbyaceae cyanobacterium SL_7_1]